MTSATSSDLLDAQIPEGSTLEYKTQRPKDIAKHVAAMVNAYGGAIIVGVAGEDGSGVSPFSVTGVSVGEETAIAASCYTRLDPPFTPEIVPVMVDAKRVLVIRVDPRLARRPVLIDGTVWVRVEDIIQRAGHDRVVALAREAGSPPSVDLPPTSVHPSHFLTRPEGHEHHLIVRSAVAVAPVKGDARFGTRFRRSMLEQVAATPLTELMATWAARHGDDASGGWRVVGAPGSQQVILESRGGGRGGSHRRFTRARLHLR